MQIIFRSAYSIHACLHAFRWLAKSALNRKTAAGLRLADDDPCRRRRRGGRSLGRPAYMLMTSSLEGARWRGGEGEWRSRADESKQGGRGVRRNASSKARGPGGRTRARKRAAAHSESPAGPFHTTHRIQIIHHSASSTARGRVKSRDRDASVLHATLSLALPCPNRRRCHVSTKL